MKNSSILLTILLFSCTLAACVESQPTLDNDELEDIVDATFSAISLNTSSEDPSSDSSTPRAELQSKWVEYWDATYGYGFAVPCHWTIYPPSLGSKNSTLTMMSFDEQFAREHSRKDEWEKNGWPQGAVKMDFIVFDIDPAVSLEAAVRDAIDDVGKMEAETIGNHSVLIGTTSGNQDALFVVFPLEVDKFLFVCFWPNGAWESTDVQGVLHSLVYSRRETITIPSLPPNTPLSSVPESCGLN